MKIFEKIKNWFVEEDSEESNEEETLENTTENKQ